MQEQLTALSQKQLDLASFPEQVVHHIEQDLAEVISRLDRQLTLTSCLCTIYGHHPVSHCCLAGQINLFFFL